jgi:hypothetical protein
VGRNLTSTIWVRIRPPESLLTLNGQNIFSVNSVKYLGIIFEEKITWRLHIGTVATKAYRTFIRLYSLFKSDRLSTNSKLTLHKALIRSIMTYACPAWEFAADTHLMKLQNKVLCTTGRFPRNTPTRDIHIYRVHFLFYMNIFIHFQIPYIYDYITKLCSNKPKWFNITRIFATMDKVKPDTEKDET